MLYLIAAIPGQERPRTYKLDRIEAVEVSAFVHQLYRDFDIEAFLSGSFGIYDGDGDITVVLEGKTSCVPVSCPMAMATSPSCWRKNLSCVPFPVLWRKNQLRPRFLSPSVLEEKLAASPFPCPTVVLEEKLAASPFPVPSPVLWRKN